jgi:hypothetical protein
MSANDYLEKLRQQAMAALDGGPKKYINENEWAPTDVPTKVRFLPLPEKEGKLNFPYMTHTYHYIQGGRDDGKDIKLFVPKKVNKDGALVEDPIDVFVRKLYDTKIDSEIKIAASLKRKRAFYFNALVYEDGVTPTLKVIVDTSGEGKLARRICSVMGIPFCKDIDDKWFPDKDFAYDPDKPYFNLVDTTSGYDFKIKKSITGKDPWNFDYNESFPITNKGLRPLTDTEQSMLKSAPDLYNYVNYESDFNKIEEYLNRAISHLSINKSSGSTASPKAPFTSKTTAAPYVQSATVEDDLSEEDLRAQLLD